MSNYAPAFDFWKMRTVISKTKTWNISFKGTKNISINTSVPLFVKSDDHRSVWQSWQCMKADCCIFSDDPETESDKASKRRTYFALEISLSRHIFLLSDVNYEKVLVTFSYIKI